MFNTNFAFNSGKLTTILDAGAGSSGKGVIGSFVTEHADNWQFACNTFMPQAGHWVKLDDGRSFFYQTFNSCAYQVDKYEKLYIAPGSTIELPAFFDEMEKNNIPPSKIGISPITSILTDADKWYEQGTHDFDGLLLKETVFGGPLFKTGSTAHGCGANRAKRVLRRKATYARDLPELQEFICDVPTEIMERLDEGQAGLLEIAQGFQLSYLLPQFYPNTTSRNCSIAAGLDDLMVPPIYSGNVIINCRTYPIRINSNKYIDPITGGHLGYPDLEKRAVKLGLKLTTNIDDDLIEKHNIATVMRGSSGGCYSDQKEVSWEHITKLSGAEDVGKNITELTSVTKLPRRVFTFSQQNIKDCIRHNQTRYNVFLSVNFADYVDVEMSGVRGVADSTDSFFSHLTPKMTQWVKDNLSEFQDILTFVGTGPRTDDTILFKPW